ncbi:MAG: DNA repair protein RecO [Blastocatellia bacterium]
MPLHETEAFVLRSWTLREADKICVFLTRQSGMVRGVAHGARKLRSRFGSSLEPFTEISLTYFQQENKELVSVSGCDIIRSNFDLASTSELLAATEYMAELVLEFLPEHQADERAYRLIGATLGALRKTPERAPEPLLRYFEIWLLKLAGFLPEMRRCNVCGKDLAVESTVWLTADDSPQCRDCSRERGEEMPAAVRQSINVILHKAPDVYFASSHDTRTLAQIRNLTTRHIGRVLERKLKSHDLLHRLKPEPLRQEPEPDPLSAIL